MSLPLIDFRGKITPETDVWLEAKARMSGRERSEIAREILHAAAVREIHEASLLHELAHASGLAGIARQPPK